MNKVVIIGCGNVGMAYAYAMVVRNIGVTELVLVDINRAKAEGEALDLNHAVSYADKGVRIYAGNYADCRDADIIVLTAGRNQEIGETRIDLLHKNYEVFKSIITEINKVGFGGIYIVATNPVDIMSLVTYKLSGLAHNRIIGSGTSLDTARLRYLVGEAIGVSPNNIHGYVLGEHGDSEVIPWDKVTVGLNPIDKLLSLAQKSQITADVRNSAYDIISKKGNTAYGIGVGLVRLTRAILRNENAIFCISCYDPKENMYYSMPAIIDRDGVREILPLSLNSADKKMLEQSIATLKDARDTLLERAK